MLITRYETAADLVAEAEIVAAAVRYFDCAGARKLDERYYVLDHALLDALDNVECFAECKDRDWRHGAGEGFFVSLFKAMRGRQLAAAAGVPAYFVPRFRGGEICVVNVMAYDKGPFIWGRADRPNDPNAIEPCVCFPWFQLEQIA